MATARGRVNRSQRKIGEIGAWHNLANSLAET